MGMWDGCLEILITSATQLRKNPKSQNVTGSISKSCSIRKITGLGCYLMSYDRYILSFETNLLSVSTGLMKRPLLGICCYYIQEQNGAGRALSGPDRCRRQQVTLNGLYMLVSVKTKYFLNQTKFIFVVIEFTSCLSLYINFICNIFVGSISSPLDVQHSAARLNTLRTGL